MKKSKTLLIIIFIVSWRISGRRPIPCPLPSPDEWGAYHYSFNYDDEISRAGAFCQEEYFDWKVKSFDTMDTFLDFMKKRPPEATNIQCREIDDDGKEIKMECKDEEINPCQTN